MATYLETQTRIANELNRSNLGDEIKLAILSAIKYYGKRRWWWNEYSTTLSTTSSVAYVALPSDFVELDELQITVNSVKRKLRRTPYSDLLSMRANSSNGEPSDFDLYQDRIELYPIPDATYTLTIAYVRSLTVLSADADTDEWLDEGEELIRTRAKKMLYAEKIRDMAMAKDLQALEDSVLLRMESLNQRRTTTGRTRAYYL